MRTVVYIVLLLLSVCSFSQQEAQFSHSYISKCMYNPAFTGIDKSLIITGVHRSQWIGIKGAPRTDLINVQSTFLNHNNSLGFTIGDDKAGPLQISTAFLSYVYSLKLGQEASLNLGFNAGANLYKASIDDLQLIQQDDFAFQTDLNSKILANVGLGAVFQYSKYTVGLSVPKFIKNDFISNTTQIIPLNNDKNAGESTEKLHFYIIGGSVFSFSDDIIFEPNIITRITTAAPITFELSGVIELRKFIYTGLLFRTGDSAGLLFGANISKELKLGYAFDYSYAFSTIKYNGGSHELFLQYKFKSEENRTITSPRYF